MVLVDFLVKLHLFFSFKKWFGGSYRCLKVETPNLKFHLIIGFHEVFACGEINFVLIDNGWSGNRMPVMSLIVVPQHLFKKFDCMATFGIFWIVNIDSQRSFLNGGLDNSFFVNFLIVNSICANREDPTVANVWSTR